MTAGKMMAGVRRTPPHLMLELEVTGQVPRKKKKVEEEEEEEGTTSAGTAVRFVLLFKLLDSINVNVF